MAENDAESLVTHHSTDLALCQCVHAVSYISAHVWDVSGQECACL